MNPLVVQSPIQVMDSPRPGLRPLEASRSEASRSEFSQMDASHPVQSSDFNVRAWDHWLLLVVVVGFSVWVLQTSWSWRQESRQHRSIPARPPRLRR